jgi:hypothetical protein
MLTVCEVYSNAVHLLYEKSGDSNDISNFKRKGNEINEVPFQSGCYASCNVTQTKVPGCPPFNDLTDGQGAEIKSEASLNAGNSG